ncbi:hypothetical protein PIB30_032548 [Stylosanthes scabra]|uniref:Uncharacterized protein n=1 Tax=Stylosanthes scabra TaxID=79078 RepID=A0ABU6ZBR6_9FABA|nr:hypothetical protein [Stylosanthes scabra]
MNTKKRRNQNNEDGEMIEDAGRSASEAVKGSSDKTNMFDSFETVSLGKDEGPVIILSQLEKESLQVEPKQQKKSKDAKVEVLPEMEVPPEVENVVEEEQQPQPLNIIILLTKSVSVFYTSLYNLNSNVNHKMLKARTLPRGKPMKIPLNPLNSNLCP